MSSMQRGRLKNVLRLTIVSLSINIGVLIAGIALMRGFQSETLRKTLHIHGHAQVHPYRSVPTPTFEAKKYKIFQTFPALANLIDKVNSVAKIHNTEELKLDRMIKRYELQGGVSKRNKTDGIIINGLEDDDAEYLLGKHVKSGSTKFVTNSKKDGAIIGYRLAHNLGVRVGGDFDLLLQSGSDMEVVPMEVVGIFDFGYYEFDSNFIFVKSSLIQDYKARSVGVLYLNKPQDVDRYIQAVNDIDPNISLISWKQRNRMIQEIFDTQVRAVALIMGLFILSAIIQSITSLFILMSERAYDISVLTMLGISNYQKYQIFAAYGLLISLSNTIFGILSGIGLTLIYPYFRNAFEYYTGNKLIHTEAFWISEFDPQIVWSDVFMVGAGTLIVMSIAMLIASYFTSRTNVMKGIKE